MAKIEDAIEKTLGPRALWVGHVTEADATVSAFYATSAIEGSVKVKTGLLKTETFPPESRPDPGWTWFGHHLAPTPLELVAHRNATLIETLEEHGDRSDVARPVDFAADFPTPEARTRFEEAVRTEGYAIDGTSDDDADLPHRLLFSKTIPVAPPGIDEVCLRLTELAESFGGDFDGWACPVVTAG